MSIERYEIRQASSTDIQLMIDWAADEGWNPGLHDAMAFAASDPGGFLIGALEGAPVECISVVACEADFGFLGFYIVKPEQRGRGLGYQIWQHGMARMGDRNVGLDGIVQQQDNYRKSGFSLAWNNIRYRGQAAGDEQNGLVPVSAVPFDELVAYDAAHFGCRRPAFLRQWLAPPAGQAIAALSDGALDGYAVIRACREGHKIGPLFAESAAATEKLFAGLAATVPGQTIYLDIPDPNPAAHALVDRHGMQPVFETARMYTRGDPGIPLASVFGVTSLELG